MKQPSAILTKASDTSEGPLVFAMLGLCPVLAVTTTIVNSVAISVIFFVVLIVSRFAMFVIRKWIGPNMAIFVLLVISSTMTAIADAIVKAFFPGLHSSLGIYLSLIAVNCLIISQPGICLSDDPDQVPGGAAFVTIKTGLVFVLIILIMGLVREILGNGTFFGLGVLGTAFRSSPVLFFVLPPGAFLASALIIAVINSFHGRRNNRRDRAADI